MASELPVPSGLALRPFRALRFAATADLASLTSPPYDVIDEEERRTLEDRSPHNVVHLILPREPREQAVSSSLDRYGEAARLLADWQRDGVLVRDPEPALYVYEETSGEHVQRGFLGGVELARADAGIVLPHEDTMAGPVADRLALLQATETNLEPIFLVFAGGGAASEALKRAADEVPLVDATTDDGTRHRLWALTDPDELTAIADDLLGRRATIADGHHRYATYLRYQEERHAAGAGSGPWDAGLAFLVDTGTFGPEVHAIHRVVPGLALDDAVRRAAAGFRVTPLPDGADPLAVLAQASGPAYVLSDGSRYQLLDQPDQAELDPALPAGRAPPAARRPGGHWTSAWRTRC